jgi:hypothetical protein
MLQYTNLRARPKIGSAKTNCMGTGVNPGHEAKSDRQRRPGENLSRLTDQNLTKKESPRAGKTNLASALQKLGL